MNLSRERWQRIATIYESAVDQPTAARDAFLSEACQGDDELRREVESLLRQDKESAVLDRPVWTTAAPLFDDRVDLAPGRLLGPYRVENLVGSGGMGQVFRATDTRLSRQVAVKVLAGGVALDQQMRARFAREAQAVAALTHPHICTLYDVGRHDETDFLVMEYLEGETLASRLKQQYLPVDEAIARATEIASALDHAHRQGIIHRDLKPGNIMLTSGGAKLLDFGLAKFRLAAPGIADVDATHVDSLTGAPPTTTLASGGSDDAHQVTRGGAILGTIRYMAPEQIEGRDVDARSDLFSFGALLYEMVTGTRAFDGDNVASIRTAILEREPPAIASVRPSVPAALDDIVRRCLAKNPDRRWQSAADLLHALKQVSHSAHRTPTLSRSSSMWIAAAVVAAVAGTGAWLLYTADEERSATVASARMSSLAVLPLADLSGDPDQEYFADGMTEQLIVDLAGIRGLQVISRTSVMQYRNSQKPAQDIARELGVDALIEGSVVRTGGKVRITAKLIKGANAEIVWSQTYERDVHDVLALQREVARTIATTVDVALTPQEAARLANAQPVDPEIHRQVLLGRYHAAKATEEGLRRAVTYFNSAIAAAPTNALAYAGLAEAYVGLSGYYVPPREAMPNAARAAKRAIELDESLADAHASLGLISLVYDWDGPSAERSLQRALALNPTLATARLHYAAYLTTQTRYDDAVREIRQSVQFDPASVRTNAMATSLLLFARHYEDAIELARRGLEFEPRSGFALAFQGVAYAEQGRFAEAVDNMERAVQFDQSPTILSLQAHVLALVGRKDEARALIRRVEESTKNKYFCPYEVGAAYVSLGEPETASRYFRKGIEERADCMAWLGVEPWIESFRSHPSYARLLRQIGLDPSVR